jgi:hypothetical protein
MDLAEYVRFDGLDLELIGLERKLNNHFANGTITEKLLNELLGEIAHIY